jgi:hypothetical protein
MGELFDYAQSMRKITDEQAKRAQTALALLRTAGLPKTVEEAAILCGALTRPQFDALAQEVRTSWHVTPPSPKIHKPDSEKDEAVIMAFRQQGRRKDVEMAVMRQQMLRAGGIEVPLWEILEAGEEPPPPAPVAQGRPVVSPPEPQGELIDAIDISPAPQASKYARKIDTPAWLKNEPEAKARPQLPLWPAETAPAKSATPPLKPQVPVSRPPTPSPKPQPVLLEAAESPSKPPTPPSNPPIVRAVARHADETDILEERLKKLHIKIGIVGAALVLVVFLIFLTASTG